MFFLASFFLTQMFSLCSRASPCIHCGEPTDEKYEICIKCQLFYESTALKIAYQEIGNERCVKCGRPLISAEGQCTLCISRTQLSFVDVCYPLYFYTPASQNLLTTWKIGEKRFLSFFFADIVYSVLSTLYPTNDLLPTLVPIPPRPGKVWKKGWDQIHELLSILASKFNCKVLHCLKRTSLSEQKKLSREERRKNLAGSIQFISHEYPPRHVLLIDDLITTGATLEECAETLKISGVQRVSALTLFFD